MKKNNSIEKLRESIDEIDREIVSLLNKRLKIGVQIGKVKGREKKKVIDLYREKKVIKNLKEANLGPVKNETLLYLYNIIIAASREIQKPTLISYLGPEATHTHIACLKFFKYSGNFISQPSIKDVFDDVETGNSKYGVVPIENSIEGAVNYTLDMLFESELKIYAEYYQSVSHSLLAKTNSLKEIKTIYSHPQAFAQSRKWLQKNLEHCAQIECKSTAEATKKATKNKHTAAIANKTAAEIYNLKVVAENIEDSKKNTTRFLIISKQNNLKKKDNKTTIMFVVPHKPGSLFKILEPVAKAHINMLKLESRPTKNANWDYFFVMDIEGNYKDEKIAKLLKHINEISLYSKIVGSYPKNNITTKL